MTIIQKLLKVRELPPEWAKEFLSPEAEVRLEIKEVDPALECVAAAAVKAANRALACLSPLIR